jgi:hypothetical protein
LNIFFSNPAKISLKIYAPNADTIKIDKTRATHASDPMLSSKEYSRDNRLNITKVSGDVTSKAMRK